MRQSKKNWKRKELAAKLRAARGIESQGRLASRSGVSDGTISLLEQGKLERPPKLITIARLALATGNDPTEWLKTIGIHITKEQIRQMQRQIAAATKREQSVSLKEELFEEKEEFFDLRGELKERLLDIESAVAEKAPVGIEDLKKYVDLRYDQLKQLIASTGKRHQMIVAKQQKIEDRLSQIERLLNNILKRKRMHE